MAIQKVQRTSNKDNFLVYKDDNGEVHEGGYILDANGDPIGINEDKPVKVSSSVVGAQKTIVSRYLDDNGDGTGNINANGNYSSTEEIFYCQPSAGEVFRISRLIVSIEDTQGFRGGKYGDLGTALSTGITLRTANDSGTIVDFTDGQPIKANAEWGFLCYDVELKAWGSGNEFLVVRYTLLKSGQFVRLDGDNNERFEAVFNDNLSGLVSHKFMIQGYIE